jgi:hypothetical protein
MLAANTFQEGLSATCELSVRLVTPIQTLALTLFFSIPRVPKPGVFVSEMDYPRIFAAFFAQKDLSILLDTPTR